MTTPPTPRLLLSFGLPEDAWLEALPGGLINETWLARDGAGEPCAVLQRQHPVFGAEVNRDIDAVTRRLADCGLETPRLLRTAGGGLWAELDGAIWRALSYVPGTTIHCIENLAQAREAGALVARFHRAVRDMQHDYAHMRPGVHDTAAHLRKLANLAEASAHESERELRQLADEIAARAGALEVLHALPKLQLRHCHGDLKISNLRFDADGTKAIALLDLDTLGRQTIDYELGDALRSWCNPRGEDVACPSVDVPILAAAMSGYGDAAEGLLSPDDVHSIAPGLVTVTLELAARFCTDGFEDNYFGWDAKRFASRREHNTARCRGQLALAASAVQQLDAIEDAISDAFG